MSELIALNFDQTLEIVKEYINKNNLTEDHVNAVFNLIYKECTPNRQYKPHQVLYDQSMIEEILAKIKFE